MSFLRVAAVTLGLLTAAQAWGQTGTEAVGLETGGSAGGTIQMAEDLAALTEEGAAWRLVPMAGRGGLQAIADLLDGRHVQLAFLRLDVLEHARTRHLFPDLETKLTYVTRLNYVEFHLLARADTANLGGLTGKTVSVGPRSGDTALAAARLFDLLKVTPAVVNDEPGAAIARLRRGEIAAVALVEGKPMPLLRLTGTTGLRLLSIPLPPEAAAWLPSQLTANDYPGLVARNAPVETVAIGTGLFAGPATPGSDTYRRLAAFVDAMFARFPGLLTPGHHPRWAEVNLSGQIPGWTRFPAADEWLKRDGPDIRAMFMRFLDERDRAAGGTPLSQQQKDVLFDQFRRWRNGQND